MNDVTRPSKEIVDRLRNSASIEHPCSPALARKAADEIERLERLIQIHEQDIKMWATQADDWKAKATGHEPPAVLQPVEVPKGLLVRAFNCVNEIRQLDLTNSAWNEVAAELNHEITRPRASQPPSPELESLLREVIAEDDDSFFMGENWRERADKALAALTKEVRPGTPADLTRVVDVSKCGSQLSAIAEVVEPMYEGLQDYKWFRATILGDDNYLEAWLQKPEKEGDLNRAAAVRWPSSQGEGE